MADKDNAKDLVNAVEKIAAAKAAKENQSLASELEKSFSNLAGVQQKLANENAKTAEAIKDGAAAELKANQEQHKELIKQINSSLGPTKEKAEAQNALDELNLNMQITAEKAEATAEWQQSSAGQAVAMKKQLEDQGKIAEDNKEYSKLSFEARKEDFKQRLADAETPAAKKQIREDMRADAKKNGDRLDKIGAGIAGMWANSKKVLIGGAKALLSTLAIGGLLIALGLFLQSDTFKKLSAYISEVIIPKTKELYDAFFGEKGGVGAGFTKLAEIFAPTGSFLIRLGLLTAKWTGKAAIKLILLPLTLGFAAIKGTFKLLGKMLGISGAPAAKAAKAAAAASKVAAAASAAAAKKLTAKVAKEAAEKIAKEKTARAVAAKAAAKASQKATAEALKAAKAAEKAAAAALRKTTAAALTKKTAEAAKAAKLANVAAIALGKKEAAEALAKRGGSMISKAGNKIFEFTASGKPNSQFTAMKSAANLAKNTLPAAAEGATKATAAVVKSMGVKSVGKGLAKGALKSTLKVVPGLGLLMGLYYGTKKAMKGDYVGAALEYGAGVAGLVPGIGTAISLGLSGAALAKDMGAFKGEGKDKIKNLGKGSKIDELKKDEIARNAKAPPISGGGYTYNTDARQSSSVTTTGSSGQSSIRNNKFGSLNRGGGG